MYNFCDNMNRNIEKEVCNYCIMGSFSVGHLQPWDIENIIKKAMDITTATGRRILKMK